MPFIAAPMDNDSRSSNHQQVSLSLAFSPREQDPKRAVKVHWAAIGEHV